MICTARRPETDPEVERIPGAELCSDKMSVFRVGSNEFLIIAEESRKEILLSFARLIQNTILEQKEDKPKVIQPITFSIGIAWDKKHGRKCRKIIPPGKTGSLLCKRKW